MPIKVGEVEALFRYPVKSMSGDRLEIADLGWDEWVGDVLSFGGTNEAAAISITTRDERCSMVNFDPGSARPAAELLKAIVRVRDNKAGV